MNKVIVIAGPTGVGKTEMSIRLAEQFPAEIISGDSMQVYKGMDIGTGKVTEAEKLDIPHHMIDIKEVTDSFSAAEFKEMTENHIAAIHHRNKIPIIVGGTGLYIESVLFDFDFPDTKRDEATTKMLEKRLQNEGNHVLYRELLEVDEAYAKKVHPNNHRRLIRALEVYQTTGMTMTAIKELQDKHPKYNCFLIGLEMQREALYDRINRRVDQMMEKGLLAEVAAVYKQAEENTQALRAIGYKELIPVLKEEVTLDTAVELLKRNSRRYAKRQMTYFKNKMDITWYEINSASRTKVQQQIIQDCHEFLQHP